MVKVETPAVKSLFGKPATPSSSSKPAEQQSAEAAALFGGSSAAAAANKSKIPVANGKQPPTTPAASSLFSKPAANQPAGGVFGSGGSLFGKPTGQSPASVFGGGAAQKTLSPFEKMAQQQQQQKSSLFGGSSSGGGTTPKSLFSTQTPDKSESSSGGGGSLFGGGVSSTPPAGQTASNVFGAKPSPQSLFGGLGKKGSTFEGVTAAANVSASSRLQQSTDSDVEFISETKPTADQIRRAEQYKLPPGFYLYEQRKPCKGCIGMKYNTLTVLL